MIINHHDHYENDHHHDYTSVKINHSFGQAGGSASLPSLVVGSGFTVPENRAYHVIKAITLDIMSFYQLYFFVKGHKYSFFLSLDDLIH